VKLRPAAIALALAAAAALLLSGCQTKSGAAALVGSTSIKASDVERSAFRLDANALALTQFGTTPVQLTYARGLVLSYSVAAEVTAQALTKLGINPTAGQREAAHDDGLSYIYTNNDQLTGAAADAQLAGLLAAFGVQADFLSTVMAFGEQMVLIGNELHINGMAAVGARIGDMGIDVRVNPRYGTWSFAQMSTVPGAVLPSFINGVSALAAGG
jgi:hypothetical protein